MHLYGCIWDKVWERLSGGSVWGEVRVRIITEPLSLSSRRRWVVHDKCVLTFSFFLSPPLVVVVVVSLHVSAI